MRPANGPSIELPKHAPHDAVDDIKQVIMSKWSEIFQEEPLKTMSGPPMHIELEDDAAPCRHYKARTVPFH